MAGHLTVALLSIFVSSVESWTIIGGTQHLRQSSINYYGRAQDQASSLLQAVSTPKRTEHLVDFEESDGQKQKLMHEHEHDESLSINSASYYSSTVDHLMRHLQANNSGCRFAKGMEIVALEGSDSERGVHFSGKASPGDELAFIPFEEFVTSAYGKGTMVGRCLAGYLEDHPKDKDALEHVLQSIYIAIYLCLSSRINGDNTHIIHPQHQPYLDTLPTREELSHIPAFWSSAALDKLEGSPVKEGIQQRRSQWEYEYGLICQALPFLREKSEALTGNNSDSDTASDIALFADFGSYTWARSVICSRAFDLPIKGGGICLVPFVDMLNHHVAPSTTKATPELSTLLNRAHQDETEGGSAPARKCNWHLDENGFFLTAPFPTSEHYDNTWPKHGLPLQLSSEEWKWDGKANPFPIEISYGSHSNGQLLMNYGFSVLKDESQSPLEQVSAAII
jgi:hypothetical protein